jgi:hypothetical protein
MCNLREAQHSVAVCSKLGYAIGAYTSPVCVPRSSVCCIRMPVGLQYNLRTADYKNSHEKVHRVFMCISLLTASLSAVAAGGMHALVVYIRMHRAVALRVLILILHSTHVHVYVHIHKHTHTHTHNTLTCTYLFPTH